MKFLVLVLVLVVAYMVWRSSRVSRGSPPPAAKPPAPPQDMVSCTVCAVHLPRGDAVTGGDGRLYCSQEHRLRGDGSG
ncbi:PP0621 family protein [Ramlibacter albus]|uniref:Deaminase n=1 Tax=Ramlibacter albus TaxID=2079448 RepID=A0A923S0D1_9BURK|nr:hypothetical protein [Ramlibacter albus]